MKKKLLSVLMCVSMIAAMTTGCGSDNGTTTSGSPVPSTKPSAAAASQTPASAAPESAAPQAGGEITYWSMWQNTEPQAKVIMEAAEAYEAETGVKVNIEWKGRDIQKVIKTAIDSGEKIDMFDDDYMRVGKQYAEILMPLDDMAAAANYETYAMPVLVNAIKGWADGKLVGVGYQPYTSGIFYDKAAFAKAGITAEPTTWAEFLDVCQKLKDAGIQPLAIDDAYASLTLGFHLARYIGQDGVKDVVLNGKWAEEPAVLKALTDIQTLKDKGYFAANSPSVFPKGENEIGFGKTAMVLNASWVPNEIQNNTKTELEWGCFSYPAVEGGVDGQEAAMIGAQAFAISKNSTNAQVAFDFIMKLTTGEFDKKMADAVNGLPSDQTNAEWPALIQCTRDSFLKLTKQYDWNCGVDENPDMKEIIKDGMLQVYEGKMTAQQFVDSMEKKSK